MNKTMKLIAAAAALGAAVPAMAKIEVGNAPELALVVYDDVAKVSYTKDLGILADTFKTQFSGNTVAASLSWDLKTDSNWTSFLGQVSASNLKWTVFGVDYFGNPNTPGAHRLFTTALNTDTNRAKVATWTNQQLTNGIADLDGSFVKQVNQKGTHGALANGSSVTNALDDQKAYWGASGAAGDFYNGRAPFSNANAVGASSDFYLLARSGAQLNKVLVDRFANTEGTFSTFALGNDYVLNANAAAVSAVPEPSTYAMLLGGLLALGLVVRRRTNDRR